jgi:Shikimate 5-dehydrogenase
MTDSTTRMVAIIGHPITQVKSVENFNRYFAQMGENRTMIPMDISPGYLGDFISLMRGWHNMDGFVVTIPHKAAVATRIDALTARAQFLRTVNVVRKDASGKLSGDMVDGDGFIYALARHGFSPAGKAALVIGAGAAGSAIAQALAQVGITSLTLADLVDARAKDLSERLAVAFSHVRFGTTAREGQAFDLVINASPIGMKQEDPIPVSGDVIDHMPADGLVADVITSPTVTPFLKRAAARGLKIQTGAEMAAAQLLVLGRFMGIIKEEAPHA